MFMYMFHSRHHQNVWLLAKEEACILDAECIVDPILLSRTPHKQKQSKTRKPLRKMVNSKDFISIR